MATVLFADDSRDPVEVTLPSDPDKALERLQQLVGGYIEVVRYRDGAAFVVNEDGNLLALDRNARAAAISTLKGRAFWLVGDVVMLSRRELAALEGLS